MLDLTPEERAAFDRMTECDSSDIERDPSIAWDVYLIVKSRLESESEWEGMDPAEISKAVSSYFPKL